jgi:quercetin dioxygenase-like cupin family protein
MPVLLQVLDGRLEVTADDRTVELRTGGMSHLPTRMPHSLVAVEPTRMLLTMLDSRSG